MQCDFIDDALVKILLINIDKISLKAPYKYVLQYARVICLDLINHMYRYKKMYGAESTQRNKTKEEFDTNLPIKNMFYQTKTSVNVVYRVKITY